MATFEVAAHVLQGITVGGHLTSEDISVKESSFWWPPLRIDLLLPLLVATSEIKCVAERRCWWPPLKLNELQRGIAGGQLCN